MCEKFSFRTRFEGMHHGGKLGQAKTNVSDSSWRVPYLHPATKKVKKDRNWKKDNIFPFPSKRSRRTVDEPKFDVFLNPTKKAAQKKSIANLTDGFQKVWKWEFLTEMWSISPHSHWGSFWCQCWNWIFRFSKGWTWLTATPHSSRCFPPTSFNFEN